MTKAMKGVDVTKRLSRMLPWHSHLVIYKFVQPHLDYGDVHYDQPNNKDLCQKFESNQHNTGPTNNISQVELYNELGLESPKFRRWVRKLCFIRLKKLA